MILFEEAKRIVLSTPRRMGIETIHFHSSIGRIIAENVYSDLNFPPFNKAAMDGFAIKEADINNVLEIIETVAAGQTPQKKVETGQATKIMTGAPVPEGADFVIQVELSETTENKVKFNGHPKNNVIPKAKQLKTGDIVLHKGEKIDARHIAVLASVGHPNIQVYKQPIIGVISTGDEIVEPENTPNPSQIRNSNGHQLVAQVAQSNAIPKYYGIAIDTYEATYNAIKKGIDECDILLLTGGVSMGDFDFVPKIMIDLGIKIHFDRVAVKPGKPTTFGTIDNIIIFGLPGNPVSSFVQFELLTKPLIYQLMEHNYIPNISRLQLSETYKRKKADRQSHIPVQIIDSLVYFSNYKGSSHIHALTESSGLITIEKDVFEIKKGDFIDVRLF